MKTIAVAPSNIAFIKYWGRKDEELRLPENGSVSMNLSELKTTTSVEFDGSFTEDQVTINGASEKRETERTIQHLNLVRKLAGISTKAKVVSENNFPTGTGLSSSASGFAALSAAAATSAGLKLSEKELSIVARQGSGSACRSVPDGFVEWTDGDLSETSYAVSLHPANYWDIVDVVAIVSEGRKDVSTSDGMKLFSSSPFAEARKAGIKEKTDGLKKALDGKDFTRFGEITESEALNMHAVMLTSSPSLIYWTPGTLEIMKAVKKWRTEGIEAYFTINTGQDIHVITEGKNAEAIQVKLKEIELVKNIIVNKPADGVRIV